MRHSPTGLKHVLILMTAITMVVGMTVCCEKTDYVDWDGPKDYNGKDTAELSYPEWMPDEMPIIGWRGVPNDHSTYSNYNTMRNCGFNTNLAFFESGDELDSALEAASQTGMRLIARWPGGFFNNPATYVPKYDNNTALMAYFIADEPYVEDFYQTKNRIRSVEGAGGTKPCYVNIHPYYTLSLFTEMGLNSYDDYVERYLNEVDPPFISFDHYPVINSGNSIILRPTWLENLEVIRKESLRKGKIFWAFVLSVPHADVYPMPTLAHLRVQINVNLAYGAQAIQYYTYWQPNGQGGEVDFTYGYHDAPVDLDGNPTDTYYLVQEANAELKAKAKLFYKGTVNSVEKVSDSYEDMVLKAPDGAVGASLTSPDGDSHLVLVNLSLEKDMTVACGEEEWTVEPGDMLLIPREGTTMEQEGTTE